MAVILTSPVLGQDVGYSYTGPLESWLLHEGYATSAATLPDAWLPDGDGVLGGEVPEVTVTPTAAVFTATDNADATVGADGNIVFGTKGGVRTTVALLTADTAAGAATKIDTALNGLANAVIASSKLEVTSVATGPTAYVTVVDGTPAVLDALGVAVGDVARGGDGRPAGASNTGAQVDVPDNDPSLASNREAPYFPTTPDRDSTIANDNTHLTEAVHRAPDFDFDAGGTDTEAPSDIVLDPEDLPLAGGDVVVYGNNLEGVTSITVGGTATTNFDDDGAGLGVLTFTAPAKAAGAHNVVLVDASGNTTVVGGLTYA